MIHKQVEYQDYNGLEGVSNLELSEMLDLFGQLNKTNDAFLSFPINAVNTFQILWDSAQQQFWVEINNDSDDMIFLQKYASEEECKELITHFYEYDTIKNLMGFYEVPVMSKTLKQVMSGK